MATDSGPAAGLIWPATGVAALLVGGSIALDNSGLLVAAVSVLGVVLLARREGRLLLAPLYGGGLLVVVQLTALAADLGRLRRVSRRAMAARVGEIVGLASLGVCAGAAVALAATIEVGRSVPLTAVATAVVLAAFAALAALARRRG